MITGIDLFIADLPDSNGIFGSANGGDAFKPYCAEHDGALTTPSSQAEVDAILQLSNIEQSCQQMSIAAYGDGVHPNGLTFYTDDSKAQQLTYTKWALGFPVLLFLNLFDVLGCLLKMEKLANGKMNSAMLQAGSQTIEVFAEQPHHQKGRWGR